MERWKCILGPGLWLGLFVFLAGCSIPEFTEPESDEEIFAIAMRDSIGDAAFDFVDLNRVVVRMYESYLRVDIYVSSMPTEFVYNHAAVPMQGLEYLWMVYFDVNGVPSFEGDVILRLRRIKDWEGGPTGIPEPPVMDTGPLLVFARAEIWLCDQSGTGKIESNVPEVHVGSRSITLAMPISWSPSLRKITETTPFQVLAYHNNGSRESSDWLPDEPISHPAHRVHLPPLRS